MDTALNIALEAIDRLKVTASSHQRAFIVEVMGRKCGYLALMAGIAGGAEAITLPEVKLIQKKLPQNYVSPMTTVNIMLLLSLRKVRITTPRR